MTSGANLCILDNCSKTCYNNNNGNAPFDPHNTENVMKKTFLKQTLLTSVLAFGLGGCAMMTGDKIETIQTADGKPFRTETVETIKFYDLRFDNKFLMEVMEFFTKPEKIIQDVVTPIVTPEPIEPVVIPEPVVETKIETSTIHPNRNNDNRAQYYFDHDMSFYGNQFVAEFCGKTITVTNNGTRSEHGSFLIKQSDVSGRGMVFVGPSSCYEKTAQVTYQGI